MKLRWLSLLALLLFFGASALTTAQAEAVSDGTESPAPEEVSVQMPEPDQDLVSQPAVAASEDSRVEKFDVDAAVNEYLARQTSEEKARSDSYFEGGYWIQLWDFLYALAVAWVFLGTGLSAWIRDRVERLTRRRPVQTALYSGIYIAGSTMLYFPWTLYTGFFREHHYDLATQTLGEWLRDQAVGLGVGVILGALALVVLYGVFRRATRTWWIWGAGVSVIFLAFLLLISPVYIDPLFNTYTPLEDAAVKDPILSMARSNGVPADTVYQFDASRQSKRISANVSGFLGTMSIRLNDNLLSRCELPEIKAVMAHEMGHYVLNHVYETLIFFGIIMVVGFGWIRWSFERAVARWGGRWGVKGIGDVAGLPLLMVLLSIYFFVMTPVLNTYIRVNEVEADVYGLNLAREPDGFAEVAMKLGEYRKLAPGPWEEFLLFDHPSGRTRVVSAMRWKAENLPGPE